MQSANSSGQRDVGGRRDLTEVPLSRRQVVGGAAALGAGLAGLPAILAACGGGSSSGQKATSAGLTKPTSKPSGIVIRTWGDPWQSTYTAGPVAAFTRKTGIPVQFDTSDYPQAQAKVLQAVRSGQQPSVGLMLTIEPEAYLANVQGISVPFDPRLLTNAAGFPSFAKPPGGKLAYVNVVSYTFPLVYVTKRVTLPKKLSWNELWKPQYRNRVFAQINPLALMAPIARMLGINLATGDLTPVFDRLKQLRPNIAAVGDDSQFISFAQRGQIDLGPSLVATSALVKGLAWRVPREGQYLAFESLYVPRGLPAPETYYAQVLANEVLSAQSEALIAKNILEVPVNPQASLPASMKGDPAFPFTPAQFKKLGLLPPIELLARKRAEWVSLYNAAIGA
jgi:spermidine/putrescine-binding protein